jgi:hypothetical protein
MFPERLRDRATERRGERRASTTLNDWMALAACPFHRKFGGISASLDRGRSATTWVPEGKHFNLLTADPVLKVVVNSRQMDTPHVFRLGVQCRGANWTRSVKASASPSFTAPGKGPILLPPSGGPAHYARGRALVTRIRTPYSTATAGKLCRHLFGRDRLATISLGDS